jgi:hypothetical protein
MRLKFRWPIGFYTRLGADRAGRADGRPTLPIPSKSATAVAPYHNELGQAASSDMAGEALSRWPEASRLYHQITDAQTGCRQWAKRLQRAITTLQAVEHHYQNEHGRRPPENSLGYTLYYPLTVGLAAGETSFNSICCGAIAHDEYDRWLLSGVLSTVFIGVAHLTGVFARRQRWAICTGLVTIAGLAMAAVAWFRGEYLRSKLLQHNHPFVPDPSQGTLAFAALNGLLFAFTFAFSYWKHEYLLSNVFDLRRAVRQAEAGHDAAERHEASARTDRSSLAAELQLAVDRIGANARRLGFAFQGSNLRTRQDRTDFDNDGYPASFHTEMHIPEPKGISNFDRPDPLDQCDTRGEQFNEHQQFVTANYHRYICSGDRDNRCYKLGLQRWPSDASTQGSNRRHRRFRKHGHARHRCQR